MGMEKTKHRARDIIFWPGMSKQIEEIVAKCSTCQERSRVNQKEPLQPHDLPTRPWQKIAVDFFEWDKREHIVAVDYFSRFYEVSTIGSTKASLTIPKLKSFFSRHGSPEEVVSDNGPPFSSADFANFAKEWDFKHNPFQSQVPTKQWPCGENSANNQVITRQSQK